MEVVEDLLHVAAVAAPVARPNRRRWGRGRGGARQGRRRRQRGVVPLRGGAVLAHVCADRRLRVPEQPERAPVRRGARCGGSGVVLFGGGDGVAGWVLWGCKAGTGEAGSTRKGNGWGGRQGKDYGKVCVTGMAKGFANVGCPFVCSFLRRKIYRRAD